MNWRKISLLIIILLLPNLALSSSNQGYAKYRIEIFVEKLKLFKRDVGRYPTSKEGLVALIEAPQDAPGWNGPYLPYSSIPTDPWGEKYKYSCPSLINGKDFDLYSFGENRKDDGGQGDDIAY